MIRQVRKAVFHFLLSGPCDSNWLQVHLLLLLSKWTHQPPILNSERWICPRWKYFDFGWNWKQYFKHYSVHISEAYPGIKLSVYSWDYSFFTYFKCKCLQNVKKRKKIPFLPTIRLFYFYKMTSILCWHSDSNWDSIFNHNKLKLFLQRMLSKYKRVCFRLYSLK